MLRRPVAAALLVGALAAVAMPAATGAAPACAAATDPHAGLVVDTGQRTTAYCVALDAPTVSGLHLIQLAADQDGLSYGLGFGGQAVCRLAGVGPDGGDCWADYPRYWGYWRDGGGGWTWSSVGAASATVREGDVDAWVWGTGMSGVTHPKPPRLAIEQICAQPASSPAGGVATSQPGSVTPSSSAGAGRPSPSSPAPSRPSPARTRTPDPSAASSPAVVIVAGAAAPPPSAGGPSAGALGAIALAVALAVAGWLRLRTHPGGART